jgi:hypothetical protein
VKRRLINVGQVRIVDKANGVSYDFRCDCAEITTVRGTLKRRAYATIVLYSMFTRGEDLVWQFEPILVARIILDGRVRIEDPAEGDGISWFVRTEKLEVAIRPCASEAIYVDRSFGHPNLEANKALERLYYDLRLARYSLLTNERLLVTTAEDSPVRRIHAAVIKDMSQLIENLEAQIATREEVPPPQTPGS